MDVRKWPISTQFEEITKLTEFDFNSQTTETRWAVEPLFPLGQLDVVLAQAGVGKSLIVEALAVHVVHEVPFGGFTTNYGDVLIIDQDTPTDVLSKRLIKFGRGLNCEQKHRLFVESMKNYTLGDGTLITLIQDYPTVVLIIIDSLHSVLGRLNPNSTGDMNYWARFKSECISTGRTVLLNHHITEKVGYTLEQLMSGNPHTFAMGSSAVIQQADTYYIIGASAENGITNRLYIRPIAKRVAVRSTPFIFQIVQPTPDSERFEFFGDYIVNFSEVETDCMTLFQQYPSDRTVKEVYENMGQKHGIIAVREALSSLHQKGYLVLSRHKSNLFKYRLP